MTIGALIAEGLPLGVHCYRCGKFSNLDPCALRIPAHMPIPALEGRFKCMRCGSTKSSARPAWGSPKMPPATAELIVR